MIQLADPAREHAAYQEAIEAAAIRVLRSGHYILGPEVDTFERAFASYCRVGHAVGVANGSDAIVVALQALGIGPGDEVITTALSYFATASTIVRTGATPVFVDIDPLTFNLDPAQVAAKITSRTKAVLPVNLFGRAANYRAIQAQLGAAAGRVHVIEDSAQGCGSEHFGVRSGALGVIACFSFFPAKVFGGAGDGGACTTQDAGLADTMRKVRITGAVAKNVHELPGGNYRLDPLQAAILGVKLTHLDQRLARRRANASALREALADAHPELIVPSDDPDGRHVYAQFSLQFPRRDALIERLKSRGVGAEVYYPVPMPYQKVLAHLGYRRGEFVHTERACRDLVAVPVHSELTGDELSTVIDAVRAAVREV
jgi:dTDP-4-amino-4,6-dideoxygalactose transaminase